MSVSVLSVLALAATLTPAASAQSSPWEPWYGCWRADDAPAGEYVCVVPDGEAARIVTLEQGVVRGDSRVYADGVARATGRDGCATLEWSRWSNDRERIFLTSQLTCDGRVSRRSQGIFAFTGTREWVSVQTITGDEGSALRTVRFTRAENVRLPASLASLARRPIRAAYHAALDEADVVEATDVLDPETVQEWLRSAGAPFQLTDTYAQTGATSALDDLARISHPVEYRTVNVVHVLEPSWCIYGSCSWLRAARCWGPWGYDRFAWRTVRPAIYFGSPVLIRLGVDIGIGRAIRIARYDGWGRDRYDYYGRDRWRNNAGYGVGRVLNGEPGRGRGRVRNEPPRVGTPRLGTATRSDVTRTARPRAGTGSGTARPTAVRGVDPRMPEVIRGSDPRSSGARMPEIIRGEPSRTASPRGGAVGRGEPSRTGAPALGRSAPARSAPARATPSRGTAVGRGDPPGTASGGSRGVARPRH